MAKRKIKIFYVEDEEDSAIILRRILDEKFGDEIELHSLFDDEIMRKKRERGSGRSMASPYSKQKLHGGMA